MEGDDGVVLVTAVLQRLERRYPDAYRVCLSELTNVTRLLEEQAETIRQMAMLPRTVIRLAAAPDVNTLGDRFLN